MKIHSAPKRLYHSNDAWCDLFACGSLEVFHKRLFAAEKWGRTMLTYRYHERYPIIRADILPLTK